MRFLFLSALVLLLAQNTWAGICTHIWDPAQSDNVNATVSSDDYWQVRNRTIQDVMDLLGPVYKEAVANLKPGDLVIDTGAGYGLARIQLAHLKQVKVVLINAQDTSKESQLFYPFSFSLEPLDIRFEIGMTQQVLPHYANSAKIIQETFGSFYYERKRNEVLEQDYDALAPDGIAVIALGGFEDYSQDLVMMSNGTTTLVDYLITEFSDVFSVSLIAGDKAVEALVMKKSPGRSKLELKLETVDRLSSYKHNERDTGFVVPDMVFRAKSKK